MRHCLKELWLILIFKLCMKKKNKNRKDNRKNVIKSNNGEQKGVDGDGSGKYA